MFNADTVKFAAARPRVAALTLLGMAFAILVVGCGGGDDPSDTANAAEGGQGQGEEGWQSFDDPDGQWTVELPGEPRSTTEEAAGLTINMDSVETDGNFYAVSRSAVPVGTPVSLEGAVQGAVTNAQTAMERQTGEGGSSEMLYERAGTLGGAETREFAALLTAGSQNARISGVMLAGEGQLTQFLAVDEGADSEGETNRFLDSLTASTA